jgi:ubiquinone/menaquinone biosynthesis C-methylase UbiE
MRTTVNPDDGLRLVEVLNLLPAESVRPTPSVAADAYDAFAGRYDEAFGSARCRAEDALLTRRLEAFLGGDGIKNILDVGCGTGQFLRLVKWWTHDAYTGLDISAEMIRRGANAFPFASFMHGSVERMNVVDESMDAVVSLYAALSYVAAPVQALDEIKRVLRSGGKCFLMVLAPRWYVHGPRHAGMVHVMTAPAAWSRWQAVQRMMLAGFKDVRLTGFSMLPTALIPLEPPLARWLPGMGRYLIIEGTRR